MHSSIQNSTNISLIPESQNQSMEYANGISFIENKNKDNYDFRKTQFPIIYGASSIEMTSAKKSN